MNEREPFYYCHLFCIVCVCVEHLRIVNLVNGQKSQYNKLHQTQRNINYITIKFNLPSTFRSDNIRNHYYYYVGVRCCNKYSHKIQRDSHHNRFMLFELSVCHRRAIQIIAQYYICVTIIMFAIANMEQESYYHYYVHEHWTFMCKNSNINQKIEFIDKICQLWNLLNFNHFDIEYKRKSIYQTHTHARTHKRKKCYSWTA